MLRKLYDLVSETTNGQLTPGGIAHLRGQLLKFDPSDAPQGIFFLNGNQETKADSKSVARNMPSELIFMVPATLKKGTYRVEVRAVGASTPTLKTAQLPVEVVVK